MENQPDRSDVAFKDENYLNMALKRKYISGCSLKLGDEGKEVKLEEDKKK